GERRESTGKGARRRNEGPRQLTDRKRSRQPAGRRGKGAAKRAGRRQSSRRKEVSQKNAGLWARRMLFRSRSRYRWVIRYLRLASRSAAIMKLSKRFSVTANHDTCSARNAFHGS